MNYKVWNDKGRERVWKEMMRYEVYNNVSTKIREFKYSMKKTKVRMRKMKDTV